MATPPTYNYLDAEALGRLKNLSIAARHVVEGFFAGMHKSPHKGFSVEFSEHRLYTPGTDPRHIDWRVFGRRDKLYGKQYEEETSMRCYLLLDKSASMGYKSDGPLTKLEYGSFLAATLAYLKRLVRDGLGREHPNPHLATPAKVPRDGAPGGLDLPRRNPRRVQRLQPEFAEGYRASAQRHAAQMPTVILAVLSSLRLQHSLPRQ